MNNALTPRYTHDDDDHQFLGRIKQFDIWYGCRWREVILRYGNEGSEYRCLDVEHASEVSDECFNWAVTLVKHYNKQCGWEKANK